MTEQLFISYARKDREQVMPWVHRLQAVGVTVWVDESGIDAALRWSQEIVEAIEGCQAFVLMMSPASVASEHVTREVSLAMDSEKRILPLFLEPTTVPVALRYPLAGLQHLDLFRGGSEENLASILRSLGRLGVTPQAPPEPVKPEPAPAVQPEASPSSAGLVGEAAPKPEKPPHNLPFEITTFIGREQEIAEVKRMLAATSLLTLVGGAGCGKTRLALHAATDLLPGYPHGVWLAELEAVDNAAFVVEAIASALGVREEPGRPLTETLTDFLKPRSTLLLLDNCEHLVVPCAQLVQSLLRACPNLRLLATSREALGVRGEAVMRVPSLSLPSRQALQAQGDLVAAVMRYEAIQLFVERATTSQPSFSVTPQNAAVVAQICLRLDGIPLALELAAARVKVLSVEQIAQRLDDQFRLLTGGSRTALPRQQTLRAAIDWSYELLAEPERALLQRLSVFAGGWSLAAAETVCAGEVIEEWEVLDLLTQLVDKSLVVVDEGIDTEPRYRLLDTIRAYARGRLGESGGDAAVRQRHAEFFQGLAEQAEKELLTPKAAAWLQQLETEHDNLRAAIGWAVETQSTEAGLRLGGALWRFWHEGGHLREGREALAAVLALPADSGCSLARAKALNGAGALAHDQGDLAHATPLHEESLAIARECGDQETIAYSLLSMGNVAMDGGEYERARTLYEEALELWRGLGDQNFVAKLLNNLGLIAGTMDRIDEAVALFEESLVLKRKIGNRTTIALALNNLGYLAIGQRNYERAAELLDESLRLSCETGNRRMILISLSSLSALAWAQGEQTRAVSLLATVATMSEAIGAVLPYDYEQNLAAFRAGLSEEEFAAAWNRGQSMTLEEAVAAASRLPVAA
jgi:non-specific serine/threonine protein kinase